MQKKTSLDRFVVRSRRMMIYTFLLILVFMYIGAKVEMRKLQAGGDSAGVAESAGAMESAAGGQDAAGKTLGIVEETSGRAGEELGGDGKALGAAGENSGEEKGNSGEAGNSGKAAGGGMEKTEEVPAQEDTPEGGGPLIKEDDMWALILTNAKYPIPEDYSVELKVLPGTEQSVDVRIYDATVRMISDMKEEGLHPIVCSAYRTLDRQEILFNRKVKNYVKRGYSMEDAYKEAQRVLSIPGSGEHCLGLAVDVFSQSYQKLETGFENTREGKWLREHCAEYGFILRYEKGKEDVTGIEYEPWHFRYVGEEIAEYMMGKGISLEEFYIEESLYG